MPLRWAALFGALALACGLEETGEAPSDASIGGKPGTGGSSVAGSGNWLDASGDQGAGGSTGGGTGTENCANGVDDDADGKVDCEDIDCTSYSCVPANPAGWEGPIAFYLGAMPVPDCTPDYPVKKFDPSGEIDIPAASCPTCTCDVTGVACPDPFVTIATGGNCANPSSTQQVATCVTISNVTSQVSAKLTYAKPTAQCAPVQSAPPSIPAPVFTQSAGICGDAALGKGCGDGKLCAPKLAAGFPSFCVYTGGLQPTCPSEYPDPSPKIIVVGMNDNRACAPCACTPPLCASSLAIYDYCGASSPMATASADGQCVGYPDQGNLGAETSKLPPSCNSSGGELSGQVDTTLITVCCLPGGVPR